MNIQLGKLPFPAHPPTLQPVSSKRIAPTYVRRRTIVMLYACTDGTTVVRWLRRFAGLMAGKFCTAAAPER